MSLLVESVRFALAVVLMVVGLVGVVVPIVPGMALIWLSVLAYAVLEGFKAIDPLTFAVLTLIALVTGTSDIWMSVLGAKKGGAAGCSFVYGFIGAIIGFFLLGALLPVIGNLFGGIIGYALGILLGEYQKHRDWNMALKASLGGVAGWGVATALQLGGGLLMILIFIWQVLSYQ
ncbi:MAG: DUF456 domain-containing protein [Chloroflexi bacterium]|nr:DUF456 domain-containing protein [Chloroflexota bacterium]MCI0647272.1 DUF456 domain-containing protein [Chloroflexota bacterium]MCI0729311.1 DUF456 domain-containing protein [Chloroflexota bacterium]